MAKFTSAKWREITGQEYQPGRIYMDAETREKLGDEIQRATTEDVFPTTKAEIVEYFKDEHGRNWKSELTKQLADATGMKRKSLERRFDPSRLGNAEKKNTNQYREFGRTLKPTKRPKNTRGKRASVHFKGQVWYSGVPYDKEFTRDLDPDALNDLLEGNIDPVMEAYGLNTDDVEDVTIESLDIDIY